MPITPGSDGIVATEKEALQIARAMGYPVMIKATAGGGGRGMRPAHNDSSLVSGYHAARNEADKAFGNSAVYLEKLIENPHHIEFQIMADMHGNVVHLGERDCSMQRRNQKIIEETPSPIMTDEIRERMGADCVRLAKEVGYVGAGTCEFLVGANRKFYFLEMNTRLQVEHPVTELVYGLDLVEVQVRVAAGEPLPFTQADLVPRGHALECRIYAEDPETFLPSPGTLTHVSWPAGPGVRVDSHIYSNYFVPPYYDSMIGKLIVHGDTREQALARMRTALLETAVEGIHTNIPLHRELMVDAKFMAGGTNIHYLEHWLEQHKR
jgi:acetyl-CoA carboxylase biotin carboxylase subunit